MSKFRRLDKDGDEALIVVAKNGSAKYSTTIYDNENKSLEHEPAFNILVRKID